MKKLTIHSPRWFARNMDFDESLSLSVDRKKKIQLKAGNRSEVILVNYFVRRCLGMLRKCPWSDAEARNPQSMCKVLLIELLLSMNIAYREPSKSVAEYFTTTKMLDSKHTNMESRAYAVKTIFFNLVHRLTWGSDGKIHNNVKMR